MITFVEVKTGPLFLRIGCGGDAVQGLDGGPDEGGAFGADSDEEEKRANRAKAASADQSSMTEARNKNTNADVSNLYTDSMCPDCTNAVALSSWELHEVAGQSWEGTGIDTESHSKLKLTHSSAVPEL